MDHLCEKYLHLLGIRKREPGLEGLKEVVWAQMSIVPFENISKLLYKKRLGQTHLVSFEQYLEGIEKYHFGGTCYANNFYLNQLLSWLGYEVKLCGAEMHMPDLHLVNIVCLGDQEFLVDTGFAAPFSEPLPLNLSTDYTIISGSSKYLLQHPDADGLHRMGQYRDGVLTHGYRINTLAREIGEFEQVIGNSFRPESTFMNNLLVTRFARDKFLSLRNMTLTESTPETSNKQTLGSRQELAQVIEKRFGIPQEIVLESIVGISLGDAAHC
ncbi:arylamine N-acetyltransferase [Bacteroidota bacterium]